MGKILNKIRFFTIIFILATLLANACVLFSFAQATTSSEDIGISFTVTGPVCGNGVCETGENCTACSVDCSCGGTDQPPTPPPPPPPTDTPPTISGVNTVTSFTTASLVWSVSDDKGVNSVSFVYGTTNSYGNSGSVVGNTSVSLANLTAGTTYYYKITATDTINQTTDYTGTFSTEQQPPPDIVPPVISNIQVVVGMNNATITFNTNENATVQVAYGGTVSYTNLVAGAQAGVFHSIVIGNLNTGRSYHYQITATDIALNSANSADAVFTTLPDTVPPPDVSNLQVAQSESSLVLTWVNPSLENITDFAGVKILRKTTGPASGPNDSGAVVRYQGAGEQYTDTSVAGNVTYYYTVYSYDISGNYSGGTYKDGKMVPPPMYVPEVCNNNLDDDGDEKTDCADTDCVNFESCKTTPPVEEKPIGTEEEKEQEKPVEPTVPEFLKLNLNQVQFLAGKRNLEITPISGALNGLSGVPLTITIPRSALNSNPTQVELSVNGQEKHLFSYDQTSKRYHADYTFPKSGSVRAQIIINYSPDQTDGVLFDINTVGAGKIRGAGALLTEAEITLYGQNKEKTATESYGFLNPQISYVGTFAWMVPNGRYYLVAKQAGYYEKTSYVFEVKNNVVNTDIELVKEPPKLVDVIDPNANLTENTINVAKNLSEKSVATTKIIIQNVAEIKEIESVQTTASVVAPVAVSVAAVSTVALVSWTNILSLLRFLFLQPLLLLGRGKRKKWGEVYNSLNKQPVDLAIVRLINAETNRIMGTKVTGVDGRYVFVVNVGKYKLDVRKGNYSFPSELLKTFTTDGRRLDVYHGEVIEVKEKDSVITVNVPLDPAGEHKTPKRLIWSRFSSRLQVVLSWAGFLVTLISLYISPKWYMWLLLGIHIFLTFIFRRIAKPKPTKGWGIVYDEDTKKPVERVVARLFDSQFNKLVATEITDKNGRYYFMAGDNRFYVTYEHEKYQPKKTDIIDLSGKPAEPLAKDVSIKKK